MHLDQLASSNENSVVFLMLIAFQRHKRGLVNLSDLFVAQDAEPEKRGHKLG